MSTEPVNINIILGKNLSRFSPETGKEGYDLYKQIKNYFKTINNSLQFCSDCIIKIYTNDNNEASPDEGFSILINDKRCRVPKYNADEMDDVHGVYYSVCYSLLQNILLAKKNNLVLSRDKLSANKLNSNTDFPEFPELIIYVNEKTYAHLTNDNLEHFQTEDENKWKSLVELFQDGMYYEFGIPVPNPVLKKDNNLADFSFQISLNGFLMPADKMIAENEVLLQIPPDQLSIYNLTGIKHINPANKIVSSKIVYTNNIKEKLKDDLNKANVGYWDSRGYLVLKLAAFVRKHAASFLNEAVLLIMTDRMKIYSPDLIPTAVLLDTLQLLLDEEISIGDLGGIFDCMSGVTTATDKDNNKNIMFLPETNHIASVTKGKTFKNISAADYANITRSYLRNAISYKYIQGQSALVVFLMSPEIESHLFESIINGSLIQEDYRKELVNAIHDEVESTANPIILTIQNVRALLREIVKVELPKLNVIAYNELSPQINIQPIARIFLEAST